MKITRRPSWDMVEALSALRHRLAPKGSRRQRALAIAVLGYRFWRQAGTAAALERTGEVLAALLPDALGALVAWAARGRDPYRDWIKRNEPGKAELTRQRQEPQQAGWPRISVLTPVYNPGPNALADTLASVEAQTYTNWELCVVDGGSDNPGVRGVLEAAVRRDQRVKLKRLHENLGISGNQNEALAMATGDYVVALDHDGVLAPDALYSIARLLSQQPSLDVVYYDEDKISEDGRIRREPLFKPSAWSPDLLLSTNVLMRSAIRRSLLARMGGYDVRFDGAQEWDAALRLAETTRRIAHLPRVYYHWRQVPGSAARDANAKPWAMAAQKSLIEAHLGRLGCQGAGVSFPSPGRVRVHWPTSGTRVSIIIPTRDKLDLLQPCLSSIFQHTTYPRYEIVLVDTGSTRADTWRYYDELKGQSVPVRVVPFTGEFNYSAANNLGACRARGELLLFLNNDIEVLDGDWLSELAGWAERPVVGIVGCKLIRPQGTIQHAGLVMGLAGHGSHVFDGSREDTYGPFGSSEWYRDYQAVTGACLMTRRAVFEALGGFDEAYQIGYGDIELGLRAGGQGYRVVYTPFARLRHHEGGSRGFFIPPADVLRAYQQMLPLVEAGDPYFSPNLSYLTREPTIAQTGEPPRASRLYRILVDFGLVGGMRGIKEATPAAPPPPFGVASGPTPVERRALVVSHELSQSGAPLLMAHLARYLLAAGYALAVLAPRDGPLRQDLEAAGIEVQIDPATLDDARAVADRLPGFGLLLANTILAWRAVHAARARQVPCLWWIQESGFGQTLAQRTPALAQAFGAADRVMFASAFTAGLYAPYLRPDQQVVLTAGPERQAGGHDGRVVDRPVDKVMLVTLASFEPRKGQDVLISALAALPPDRRRQIELYLMGQVLDRRYYRRLQQKAGPGLGIHLLGAVPHLEAMAYLAVADVFVLPSRDEVMPVALLEAMALGKPIVATTVGGIPEAVEHRASGWLVPPDDPGALAQALDHLVQDRALRHGLGQAAQARFEAEYRFDKFGRAVADLLRRLVEDRQARQRGATLGQREGLGEPLIHYEPPASLAAPEW
ncbi:MAG: glycosyltransferase [Anaerolineales bacterium]|nr:glycosyltransferase [Anaerolineales bacterium]